MNNINLNTINDAIGRSQFELNYQPQVDSFTGKIVGMEALIRWNHPSLGKLGPKAFMPIVEQSDLVVKLGDWVINTACEQNKSWQLKGYAKIPVSVNVSANHLMLGDTEKTLYKALYKNGLSPRCIELEITEESRISDFEKAVRLLGRIKENGTNIAIDDFGTAYSSFSYLRELPVGSIKIDKSFVDGIGKNRKDEAIISMLVSLIKKLNLDVVAEGVETKTQLDFLKSIGCKKIQGFYYYRPMPAHDVEYLLGRNIDILA